MKKILFISLFLACCVTSNAFSQNSKGDYTPKSLKDYIEMGFVKKSDLKDSRYAEEYNSDAVVIYEQRYIFNYARYGTKLDVLKALNTNARYLGSRVKVMRQIKILETSGLKYGKITLQYPNAVSPTTEQATIHSIAANSYTLAGNKMQKQTLSADDVTHKRIDDKTMQTEINIPNVEVGSIIEYTYEIDYITTEMKYDHSFALESDLPIIESEYMVQFDEPWWQIDSYGDFGFIADARTTRFIGSIPKDPENLYTQLSVSAARPSGNRAKRDFTQVDAKQVFSNKQDGYITMESAQPYDSFECSMITFRALNVPAQAPKSGVRITYKQ